MSPQPHTHLHTGLLLEIGWTAHLLAVWILLWLGVLWREEPIVGSVGSCGELWVGKV